MIYLSKGELEVNLFARAIIWLDTGTFDSLYEAGALVKSIENKQIFKIGCPEEISWRMGWINTDQLNSLIIKYKNNEYGNYLKILFIPKICFNFEVGNFCENRKNQIIKKFIYRWTNYFNSR